ncbi:MAG: hypothetical protein J0L63_01905 [Anaerolineae bacterium]|nr:hypothetical protein [Anaerolineae bacterium]MBN8617628.1 hypothetical protein [Anaerolineae bacterium]
MERWEYLTKFIKADIKNEGVSSFFRQYRPNWKNPPPYTPEAMMPELDDLGNQGWELIHMEPVARVGKKGDVLFQGGAEWSNSYFCVFKRRKPAI